MAKRTYEDMLLEEEQLEEKLKNRIVKTGETKGGAPIERDADPAVTTAMRARLNELREEKKKFKEGLDPVDRMARDLYESFLKANKKK